MFVMKTVPVVHEWKDVRLPHNNTGTCNGNALINYSHANNEALRPLLRYRVCKVGMPQIDIKELSGSLNHWINSYFTDIIQVINKNTLYKRHLTSIAHRHTVDGRNPAFSLLEYSGNPVTKWVLPSLKLTVRP